MNYDELQSYANEMTHAQHTAHNIILNEARGIINETHSTDDLIKEVNTSLKGITYTTNYTTGGKTDMMGYVQERLGDDVSVEKADYNTVHDLLFEGLRNGLYEDNFQHDGGPLDYYRDEAEDYRNSTAKSIINKAESNKDLINLSNGPLRDVKNIREDGTTHNMLDAIVESSELGGEETVVTDSRIYYPNTDEDVDFDIAKDILTSGFEYDSMKVEPVANNMDSEYIRVDRPSLSAQDIKDMTDVFDDVVTEHPDDAQAINESAMDLLSKAHTNEDLVNIVNGPLKDFRIDDAEAGIQGDLMANFDINAYYSDEDIRVSNSRIYYADTDYDMDFDIAQGILMDSIRQNEATFQPPTQLELNLDGLGDDKGLQQ